MVKQYYLQKHKLEIFIPQLCFQWLEELIGGRASVTDAIGHGS